MQPGEFRCFRVRRGVAERLQRARADPVRAGHAVAVAAQPEQRDVRPHSNPPVAYDVVCRQSLTGCGVGIQLGRPPLRGVPGAAAQHGRQREEGRRKDVAAAGALPRPAAVSERSGN